MAGIQTQQYDQGLIKRHELTRQEKEEDRVKHTLAINANAGPVFLAYRDMKQIDTIVARQLKAKPEYSFLSSDGIRHTLWVVSNASNICELQEAFGQVPCLYIADGHHRASVANIIYKRKQAENPNHSGNEEYCYFLAVMFPQSQLKVMDYNRVMKDLNGLTEEQLLKRIAEKFSIVKAADNAKPIARRTFKLYLSGVWYELRAKPGTYVESDPVKSLDVAILQDNLLGPVLGIDDPRKSERIDFVGGIRGMAELEHRCNKPKGDCVAAFALYPMSMDELLKIADAGQLVPPKSTWFEPKLKSGLVVKSLS